MVAVSFAKKVSSMTASSSATTAVANAAFRASIPARSSTPMSGRFLAVARNVNQPSFNTDQHSRSYSVLAAKSSPLLDNNNRSALEQPNQQQCHQVRQFSSGGKEDFYKVLGVSKSADKGDVKKAYFKQAKMYHPDTNKDDKTASDKFKKATEAYECLSDEKQRKLYDQFGHAGVDPNFQAQDPFGGGGNPFGGGGGGGMNFDDGSFHFSGQQQGGPQMDPDELFDMFFGSGQGGRSRRNRGPRRGSDLQMHVKVSFKEAVFGVTKDVHVRYQVQDSSTGEVQLKEREVSVDIPAGIDNGMNLRLAGQGAEGDPGAPKGNLLVQVIVSGDEYYIRDGFDVHTEIPIRVTQAILGGVVDVETLHGIVEVKIPKGCQPGVKLLLRGKGIQVLRGGGKGNQIVHLGVQIPKEISKEQERLLREFDEEEVEAGKGVAGRLAEAVGSTFEKFFGGDKKKAEAEKEGSTIERESEDAEKESSSSKKESADRVDKLFGQKKKKTEDSAEDDNADDGDDDKKKTAQ